MKGAKTKMILYDNAYMNHITCKFHKLLPTYVWIRTETKFLYMPHQDEWKFVDT